MIKIINEKGLTIVLLFILVTGVTFSLAIEHHTFLEKQYGPVAEIFFPLVATISFVIGGYISLMFQWGISLVRFSELLKLLPKNERKVMEILFDKKIVSQKELSILTELSKVKVSRTIPILEKRGVVTKKQINNQNIIESKIFRTHPSVKFMTRFSGITEGRIIIAMLLILSLGIFISVLNSYHILKVEHPFKPIEYLVTFESLALGGLTMLLLQRKISGLQFYKSLKILPKDESKIIRFLSKNKNITQAEIVEKTGIYKMKVSRIISKFKNSGIVEKKPYGNTNLIILKI